MSRPQALKRPRSRPLLFFVLGPCLSNNTRVRVATNHRDYFNTKISPDLRQLILSGNGTRASR
jgi:hypothetical protein